MQKWSKWRRYQFDHRTFTMVLLTCRRSSQSFWWLVGIQIERNWLSVVSLPSQICQWIDNSSYRLIFF
jgi:hypothetical protein